MQQRSESGSGIRQRDSNGASMKKICFITTVPATLNAFVVGVAEFLHQQAGYDITFICDRDEAFAASLPPYIHYIPVSMKRGIHPGGISAIFKMIRIFRREKFDMVQYSTPNASFYSATAARIARIPIRKYHLMGFRYLGFDHLKRKIFKAIELFFTLLWSRLSVIIRPSTSWYSPAIGRASEWSSQKRKLWACR